MVAIVVMHSVRVLLTGSYRERELNWCIGLCMLVITLGLAFTGYLLPWDQLSYWAVSVSASLIDYVPYAGSWLKHLLLGGETVGQASLSRFYMLHVAALPALLVVLVALHIWRIRKDGGLVRPPASEVEYVPARPHLVLREAALALAVIAAFALIAHLLDAPLMGAADPHHPSNPEKTPWYFLWLQEMVSYSAPLGGFVFPGLLGLWLLLVPFLDREDEHRGVWLGGAAARAGFAASAGLAVVALVSMEWLYMGRVQTGAGQGLDIMNPAAGMLALAGMAFLGVGAASRSTRAAFMAGFAVVLVAVSGFTVIGLCRGPGWVFFWPWEAWSIGP